MKTLLFTLSFILITSCASNSANKALADRGITDSDQTEITAQFEEYKRIMSKSRRGTGVSLGFGGFFGGGVGGGVGISGSRGSSGTADQNIQKVLCTCYSKLNDKCLSSSKLAPSRELRSFWIKGHAAKLALEKFETGFDEKVMCN